MKHLVANVDVDVDVQLYMYARFHFKHLQCSGIQIVAGQLVGKTLSLKINAKGTRIASDSLHLSASQRY